MITRDNLTLIDIGVGKNRQEKKLDLDILNMQTWTKQQNSTRNMEQARFTY